MVNPGLQRYLTNSPTQWFLFITTASSGLPGSPQSDRTELKQQVAAERLQRAVDQLEMAKSS